MTSIEGLDDTEATGDDSLADLRKYRDGMRERTVYWRQRLMKKRMVLSSDLSTRDSSVCVVFFIADSTDCELGRLSLLKNCLRELRT